MQEQSPIPQSELAALAEGLTTVAVTGTNGKTTTTTMVAAIARAAGWSVARITTLGMWVDDERVAEDRTMPSFVRTLRRARELGARLVALEVTSRALEAGFAERWPADVAAFTNLTPDHLDRHGTPERYLAAKAQLFLRLREGGVAVLNAADPASELLAEVVPAHASVRRYAPRPVASSDAADLAVRGFDTGHDGLHIELTSGPLADAIGSPLSVGAAGDFNVDNAVCAALAATAAGLGPHAVRRGLADFAGIEGRFQVIAEAPLCVVDFAHTPDALERALSSARRQAEVRGGRLACVFGCGGERDQAKRAPMGSVADRLSDAVWLTTDNPRGESPETIAAMVRAGFSDRAELHEVAERAHAVAQAVAWARPRDVVVVAGRGAERVQELGSGPSPCWDVELVRAALRARPA